MSRLRQWFNQLQLSLFGDESSISDQSTQRVDKPKKAHPHFTEHIKKTPKIPFKEPTQTPQSKVRMVALQNQQVPYIVERARRRTVGMIIEQSGLRVRASSSVSILEIESILQQRADWILKSLGKVQSAAARVSFVPDFKVLMDGGQLNILGREVQCVWYENAPKFNAGHWFEHSFLSSDGVIDLVVPNVSQARREKILLKALTDILLIYLSWRADYYVQNHGLSYRSISLSSAKTLWGTCKSDGSLRLNWRLVFLDQTLVDYVLAHELSHTVHMNHSRSFWQQVERLCPNYKNLVQELKKYNLRGT